MDDEIEKKVNSIIDARERSFFEMINSSEVDFTLEKKIELISKKITYPNKFISSEEDSYFEAITIIKSNLQYDKLGIKPDNSYINLYIIFKTDPYLKDCIAVEKGNKIYTAENYISFEENNDISENIDVYTNLIAKVRNYIYIKYESNWSADHIYNCIEINKKYFDYINQYIDHLINNFYTPISTETSCNNSHPLFQLLSYIKFLEESSRQSCFEIFDLWYKKLAEANIILYYNLANTFEYSLDVIPVLIGKTGIGKSVFIRSLIGKSFKFFQTFERLYSRDKDDEISLANKLICEIPDIVLKFHKSEEIKAFISKTESEIRPAYGRTSSTFRRRSGMICSSDKFINLFNDPESLRRFFPIEIEEINIPNLEDFKKLSSSVLAYYFKTAKENLLNCLEMDNKSIFQKTKIALSEKQRLAYENIRLKNPKDFLSKETKEYLNQKRKSSSYSPLYEEKIIKLLENRELIYTTRELYIYVYGEAVANTLSDNKLMSFGRRVNRIITEIGYISKLICKEGKTKKVILAKEYKEKFHDLEFFSAIKQMESDWKQ